ncbi:MAG: carboxypeptidase regulatory-like domain-containing protein [Candidatus Sulfotelmatobacter sp.]
MNRYSFHIAAFVLLVVSVITLCAAGRSAFIPAAGGTSVTGVVKFKGTAPRPTRIDMSADPYCAKEHPSGATSEDVLTDATGNLENVVVFISDGLGTTTFPIPDQPAAMEQKGCQYKPHVLAMRAGQKLKVVNSDGTTHNIHPMPNNNREWNVSQPPGTPLEQVFAREEIAISVKCNIHPWMRSYIAVLKNPYFAVTDKNGSFEIKDLPPGTYTLQAWHEKLGNKMQKITVGEGAPQTVDFVFQ